MHRPRDDRPVGPAPAVGDEEMQVWMPVRTRAMRLQTRDEADLAHEPVAPERLGDIQLEHLDRDIAIMLEIAR